MANGMTINTTNNSSNNGAEMMATTTTTACHDTTVVRIARTVVQEILEQIRDKDAPPINERPSSLDSPSSTTTHDDDESVHPSFVPLGHAPLVALCEAALRDDDTPGEQRHALHRTQEQAPIMTECEEKKEADLEATTALPAKPIVVPPTTPRLHLFGSEYARYSTQCRELRPISTTSRRPPVQPRLRSRSTKSNLPPHRYLSHAPPATQVGALLDICVAFHANDPPPSGYYRIPAASSNNHFFLHVKQEPSWDKAAQRPCLTALVWSTTCPPGFSTVRVGRHGPPALWGQSTNNSKKKPLLLCLRRSREGNPLTGLLVLQPPTAVPDGYTVLERTTEHHAAVVPNSHNNPCCFLAVRQRLCSLEATIPPVLLRAGSYYATNHTQVPATQLGRFHVLDRSTHALLSPSALTHRLQWLQQPPQGKKQRSDSWSTSYAESGCGPSPGCSEQGDAVEDGATTTHLDAVTMMHDFIPRVLPHPHMSLLLHTILTACYTRHGGAAWVALQGLTRLLEHTTTNHHGRQHHDASSWWWQTDATHTVSALDVATQAVCDIATSGSSLVVVRAACVEACRIAVRTGQLGARALGFVVRCYWFVWLSSDTDAATTVSSTTADQNPTAVALQELVTMSLRKEARQQQRKAAADDMSGGGYLDCMMKGIVDQAIDKAVDSVDRAQWMQQVLHQITKSGGSELFWHEMVHTCGTALWGSDGGPTPAVVVAFAVLESLVKVACAPSQASKGLSLDLLLHWLTTFSANDTTLVYAVRRTVVPCLLSNSQASLEHPHMLRRVLRIMTVLWSSPAYRNECKIEIGVLLDHFVLRLLQLGPQWSGLDADLVAQQVHIMEEIEIWFSNDSADALEVYFNYDADGDSPSSHSLPPGPQWNVFQRLVFGLSSIAEGCGELISQQIQENQSLILDPSHDRDNRKDSQAKARKRESARLLRKASLQTLCKITNCLALSASSTAGIEFSSLLLSWFPDTVSSALTQTGTLPVTATGFSQSASDSLPLSADDEELLSFWRGDGPEAEPREIVSPKPQCSSQDSLQVAFAIADTKSLKKAIEYLIACNVLAPTPRDIANFVQVHKDRFEPSSLGDYLSESGNGGAEIDFWTSLRHHYVRSISFIGMTVETGFRHFITTAGFSLPGEAQKIDRVLVSFARCYFEDNAGDTMNCPFQDEDTVYLLTFAIVMLNTDLHKNTAASGRKSPKKMTKVEFINNLKAAVQHDVLPRQYASRAYDSIAATPIQLHAERSSKKTDRVNFVDNVGHADSMLRGVAVHQCKFASILHLKGDALPVVSRLCFSKIWHNLHGVVNTCLECAHLDPEGLEPAIDILLFGLVITICLDMRLERSAFLSQFVRLCLFGEKIRGRVGSDYSMRVKQLQWFEQLEGLCSGPTEYKIEVLRKIRAWVGKLKGSLRVDLRNKSEMGAVVAELAQGDFLLNDPARAFLQSGNLVKRSNKTGRSVEYRFFLFSDLLLYASKQDNGKFKIHEELPLHFMKIVDWFPVNQKGRHLMFQIHHPRKTFVVVCPTPESRRSWVEDIRGAVMVEMERKMVVEAARASTH